MIRSIFLSLFLIVLAFNVEQTEGLAAIVRRVRNAGLFGIGRRAQRSAPHAAANVKRVYQAPRETSIAVPPATAFDSFDADAYRREMTDLVYQRNMRRLHVN